MFTVAIMSWDEAERFLANHSSVTATISGQEMILNIKNDSQRYQLFRENRTCVSCGLVGEVMKLEAVSNLGVWTAHFNLYSKSGSLFTKDHIIPRSKGGPNCLSNYQTMCFKCNQKKGSRYVKI